MPWSRPFDDPIEAEGKVLETLRDAAGYVLKLPKAEQRREHWQVAMRCLIGAAEDRDFVMHARIGMMRALNFGKPRPEVTRGKSVKAYRVIR